jgi:hypothetical protein
MAFQSWKSYWNFARKTRFDQRYIHDKVIDDFLSEVLRTSTPRIKSIKKGAFLWRAQLGHGLRPIFNGEEETDDKEPSPHSKDRMVPPPYMASEGRANPKGMPYLYLAADKETAMSEVRPWIGSKVSVGQFQIKKDLKLIDCFENDDEKLIYVKEPDNEKKEQVVWSDIDRAFSEPVIPTDNQADYVPTQIISELFKNNGYDGVIYKSMLGKGLNFALFDIQVAKIVNCSLYEVEEISIKFKECANPYFVSESESEDE